MTQKIADHYGEWVAGRRLGAGGFGEVLLVQKDRQQGALKVCHSTSGDQRERFLIEIESLRRLSHQGIPKILDVCQDVEERAYFVMTVAPGETLLSITDSWNEKGRYFGQVEALRIAGALLDILSYIHKSGFVHRDIKDANVIVDLDHDSLSVTLIDFGFCKAAGTSEIRTLDSFWRVGNSRFGPPSKHDDPGLALPTHDVFAVGVLIYRMLTGLFPWSVGPTDDVGPLHRSMINSPLVPPAVANPSVSGVVSRFVSHLLSIDDDHRPEAVSAKAEVQIILEALAKAPPPTSPTPSRAQAQHFTEVLRDNIHGDIRLTDYEYRLIGTPEFQRLRHIRQLGLANLVFPGAEHTRLIHSIGTMDRVETMLRSVEDQSGVRIDPDVRLVARLHGLLHDICHIPMGHTIEDQFGLQIAHDKNSSRFERLVRSPNSQVGRLLRETEHGRAALELLDPDSDQFKDDIVSHVVSGVVGADILDYVDRDSWHCGLGHRVDTALLRHLRLQDLPSLTDRRMVFRTVGKYGLRVDREFAVESLLLERYALFLKVYTHGTKIAADTLMARALTEAFPSRKGISDDWFDCLGDDTLMGKLDARRKPFVKDLVRRLRQRILPMPVYRGYVLPEATRNEREYQHMRGTLVNKGLAVMRGKSDLEAKLASY
jgi:HD superfamily phosphohydrolase/tRNA A-37 threonylcarbamoyl transferase component Bud32